MKSLRTWPHDMWTATASPRTDDLIRASWLPRRQADRQDVANAGSPPPALASLVGASCKATRTGSARHGPCSLAMTDTDCRLVRCPELGAPLWLLAGESQWIRTSPIVAILVEDRAGLTVIVCTQRARYCLVFANQRPLAPA